MSGGGDFGGWQPPLSPGRGPGPAGEPSAPAVPPEPAAARPPLRAGGVPRLSASEPAAWGQRAAATLLDGLIVLVAGWGVASLVPSQDADDVLRVGVAATLAIALLYPAIVMARTNGQTLGKLAAGIRVVRTSGEPVTFAYAFVREALVKQILFFGIGGALVVGLLDVLWPLWDPERRALHDMLVSSRVMRAPPADPS